MLMLQKRNLCWRLCHTAVPRWAQLVFQGSVTSDNWVAVTLAYIGTQALVDMATAWKHGKQ